MADSSEILSHLYTKPPQSLQHISYPFLVPNLKGLEAAIATASQYTTFPSQDPTDSSPTDANAPPTPPSSPKGDFKSTALSEVAIFAAATESFSQKNINCSVAESIERFAPVIEKALANNIKVRGYISVVLGCPYEGPPTKQSIATTAALCQKLLEMGCHEISLGDTTGMGTASTTLHLLQTLETAGVPFEKVAGHFHDTYGQALVNTLVSLEKGVRVFDSSVGGLGGCPYAKGATGNVATEDLLYFLDSVGMRTGVNLEAMSDIGAWISKELRKENGSRVGRATISKRV
jgi:hydroxymethylglutaryl-CoA lyase